MTLKMFITQFYDSFDDSFYECVYQSFKTALLSEALCVAVTWESRLQ
jgi:hypothetical protein